MSERAGYLRDGAAIYERSFAIIRSEADLRASARSPEVALVLEDEKNLFDLATRFTLVVSEHVMVAEPRL